MSELRKGDLVVIDASTKGRHVDQIGIITDVPDEADFVLVRLEGEEWEYAHATVTRLADLLADGSVIWIVE